MATGFALKRPRPGVARLLVSVPAYLTLALIALWTVAARWMSAATRYPRAYSARRSHLTLPRDARGTAPRIASARTAPRHRVSATSASRVTAVSSRDEAEGERPWPSGGQPLL